MKEMEMKLQILLILSATCSQLNALLWPASSSMSVVSSVSVPILELLPDRKFRIDWCFTASFSLPNEVSSFYNIPIWPGKSKRDTSDAPATRHNDTHLELFKKYASKPLQPNKHPKDFSAGELYQSLEDLLVRYGFHDTCLLRTVCELAQHPFDDRQENIVTEIITFMLTPSLHVGFDVSEQLYREAYEQAELRGFLGEDCSVLYSDCKKNIMDTLTKVFFD